MKKNKRTKHKLEQHRGTDCIARTRESVCVCVEGKHCSGAVTSNASAEHMAPQREREGGRDTERERGRGWGIEGEQAVLTDSLLQQPETDCAGQAGYES